MGVANFDIVGTNRYLQQKKGLQKLSSLKSLNSQNKKNETGNFHSYDDQTWLPYQILGGKAVKYVQIYSQTTELWEEKLNVTCVRE